jgi:hypothetical protein
MLLLYNLHISFYILLVSNSYILPLNILLCSTITAFGHRGSAAYFLAVEPRYSTSYKEAARSRLTTSQPSRVVALVRDIVQLGKIGL